MRTAGSDTKESMLIDCVPPDGTYQGIWSGFKVRFFGNGRSFETMTKIAVKGTCDCVVLVDQGNVIVSNG